MIAVIGGGPAGCNAARLLAEGGKEVCVFEEHKKIGSPVQCTGIVTSSISSLVRLKKEFVVNKIKKARIYSQKSFVELRLKNENIILDRQKFDSYLADESEKAGAKIFLNHKFIGNSGNKVITDKKTVSADKIIGADGPVSGVAKINGMYCKRNFWVGMQARARLKNDNAVEFYPAIGTYAWIVPESEDVVRIGVAAERQTKEIFEKFVSKKIDKKSIIDYQAGLIPVYNPKQQTQKGNVYLVGDAACQVKATTGGGIIQAMTAGQALADSILNNKNYQIEWKKRLGTDLWLHLKMRKVMDRFSEKDWQSIISMFSKEKNKQIIENFDRDYPTRYLLKLLANEPRLLLFARHLFC